jgi:hypothetical protein
VSLWPRGSNPGQQLEGLGPLAPGAGHPWRVRSQILLDHERGVLGASIVAVVVAVVPGCEARVVARLEHDAIVPLHDFWRDPDQAYLVMR